MPAACGCPFERIWLKYIKATEKGSKEAQPVLFLFGNGLINLYLASMRCMVGHPPGVGNPDTMNVNNTR